MKINKKLKIGFTLAELMVFFVFISIILAASMPLITKKARNIPAKMHHGKYICTQNDDGTFNEEYYNSFKRIKPNHNIEACSFTPPKQTSLFKIELIGGGAGGFEFPGVYAKHSNIPSTDERADKFDGYFKLKPYGSTMSGSKGWQNPPMGILVELLTNANFVVTKYVLGAGQGEKVDPSLQYTGMMEPFFNDDDCYELEEKERECTEEDKDEDKKDGKCYEMVKTVSSALISCANKTNLISDIQSRGKCSYEGGDCYVLATEANSDWAKKLVAAYADALPEGSTKSLELTHFGTGTMVRPGWGCYGGKGTKIYVEGKIDWMDYYTHSSYSAEETIQGENEREEYLKNLFTKYYVTGNTDLPGVCSDFDTSNLLHSVYNYHDGEYDPKDNDETNGVHDGAPTFWDEEKNLYQDFSMRGRDGYDIVRYDAIKVWNHCVTNRERATGGKGGYFELAGDELRSSGHSYAYGEGYSKYYDISAYCETGYANQKYGKYSKSARGAVMSSANGEAPFGQTGFTYGEDSTKKSVYPYIWSNTRVNVREHTVGEAGGAAKPKVFYTTNLGSDCVIRPGKAGDVAQIGMLDKDITDLEKSLVTSMSCNEGTYNISVEGGSYNRGQQFTQKHHTITNLTSKGDITNNNPSEFITPVPEGLWSLYYAGWEDNGGPNAPYVSHDGEKSLFKPSGVFTKFILGVNSNFGAGGNGSKVIDKCVEPRGTGDFELRYEIGYDENEPGPDEKTPKRTKNIAPLEPCTEEMVKHFPAKPGQQGAVIITW